MSTDSGSSSSVDTQQLIDTQDDILARSKQIEAFIKKMKKNSKKSNSFQLLETSFMLFKSEMKINLTLRKSFLRQQAKNEKEVEEFKQKYDPKPFFDELSRISHRDICDYNCALDLFSEISTVFLNSKEKLKTKIKKIKEDNQKLVNYGQEMQQEYQQLENDYTEQENSKKELETKLQEANDYIEALRGALNDSNAKIETLQKENESLKKESEQAKTMEQQKIDILSKTLQSLKKELNDVTEQLQSHQVQLAYETSHTEEINNQLNNERNEKNDLENIVKEMKKKLKSKKSIISGLKQEVVRLQEENEAQKQEMEEIHKKEIAEIKKNFETNINAKISKIETAIKEKDQQLRKIKSNFDEATSKLAKAERQVSEQQQITMKYKEENERLREKMRHQN